jgi:hypothetical protein
MADSDRVERFFQELDRRGHEPLLERMQALHPRLSTAAV